MNKTSAPVAFVVTAVLLAAARPVLGQADVAQLLMELQRQEDQAEAHNDVATLDRILADDLLITQGDGTVLNKVQLLESLSRIPADGAGTFRYADVIVHEYGDAAIVSYRATFDPGYAFRLTVVWVRRQGLWKTVATHVSPPL